MSWLYGLSLVQVVLVVSVTWLALGYFAARLVCMMRGTPFSDDRFWVVPSLAIIELCVIVASIPTAWKCAGTGICPENPLESCLYYFFALLYLVPEAIKKIAMAPAKTFKQKD
jgi:hypothetical protein